MLDVSLRELRNEFGIIQLYLDVTERFVGQDIRNHVSRSIVRHTCQSQQDKKRTYVEQWPDHPSHDH